RRGVLSLPLPCHSATSAPAVSLVGAQVTSETKEVPENQPVDIPCSAYRSDWGSPRIEWKFQKGSSLVLFYYAGALTDPYKNRVVFSVTSIHFSTVTREDTGKYICEVVGDSSQIAKSEVNLIVQGGSPHRHVRVSPCPHVLMFLHPHVPMSECSRFPIFPPPYVPPSALPHFPMSSHPHISMSPLPHVPRPDFSTSPCPHILMSPLPHILTSPHPHLPYPHVPVSPIPMSPPPHIPSRAGVKVKVPMFLGCTRCSLCQCFPIEPIGEMNWVGTPL
uniref:Ig-like domain-containing protein n=1 Tax=Chrysolophus pictus TaxID=9089 RepID=A0A8C3LAU9_CHRPC